jgi:hypothetical protein
MNLQSQIALDLLFNILSNGQINVLGPIRRAVQEQDSFNQGLACFISPMDCYLMSSPIRS